MPDDNYIRIPDLVPRRLYRIRSRNLIFGVYNPEKNGFLGIREKFGSRYVFEEHHWDQDYYPTVKPIEDLGIDLPDDILLAEHLPGSWDKDGVREVYFDRPVAEGGKGWLYKDTDEPAPAGYIKGNDALFAWLDEQEKTYARREQVPEAP